MNILDRVRKTIAQHKLIQCDETIVLGISGGPDSLALAHLLCVLSGEWHLSLHLVHLNHQLRGADSDADAEFIAWLAREWNLPATIESQDVGAYAKEKKLSIEEAARQLRYEFLFRVAQNVGAHTVAVAHHADDQVETVLMHLLRGAGMTGLRGMKYKSQLPNPKSQNQKPQLPITNYPVEVIRPLLDATRAEIETYCRENDLHPRYDLSNNDTTLFRNRLRQEVLPYLETLNPNLREILRHTSRSQADDYNFLQTQVVDAFARVAHEGDGAIIFDRTAWRVLHPALQRGTLRVAVQHLQQSLRDISWVNIEDARVIALEKDIGAMATLPHGLRLMVGYDEFFIADEARAELGFDLPQLIGEPIALPRSGVIELAGSEWVVEVEPHPSLPLPRGGLARGWGAFFDSQKIVGEIFLCCRKPGDKFQPAGMNGHTKSLHEFMIDEKIPQGARARLPLLCDMEKILWVCGYRSDERVRVTERTREVVQIAFRKKEIG